MVKEPFPGMRIDLNEKKMENVLNLINMPKIRLKTMEIAEMLTRRKKSNSYDCFSGYLFLTIKKERTWGRGRERKF